jgi:GTP-binding protein
MFVDKTINEFKAGKGGDGCVSFRREKCVPKGGPDGGDGGNGGSVILIASNNTKSLANLRYMHLVKAENGKSGSSSNKKGRSGEDKIIEVPIGTVVKSFEDEDVIFDFTENGQQLVITAGGNGGFGNTRFKSSVNRVPRQAKPGLDGERIKVILELKLIAFAGLVGFPNAGKSTLISKITKARPKIAGYPFTTLTPKLGVLYQDRRSCVIADIPGILENAHKGEGMGLDFLKHIERTKLLIYMIDNSKYTTISPLETFQTLQEELKLYKKEITHKDFFVVLNKMDIEDADTELTDEFLLYCKKHCITVLKISALKMINLNVLQKKIFEYFDE